MATTKAYEIGQLGSKLTVDSDGDLAINSINGLLVDTDTLTVDPTNNRVGIGTASPSTPLHVQGALTLLGLGQANGVNLIKMGEAANADEFRLVGNFSGIGGTGNNITFTSNLEGEKNIMTLSIIIQ